MFGEVERCVAVSLAGCIQLKQGSCRTLRAFVLLFGYRPILLWQATPVVWGHLGEEVVGASREVGNYGLASMGCV